MQSATHELGQWFDLSWWDLAGKCDVVLYLSNITYRIDTTRFQSFMCFILFFIDFILVNFIAPIDILFMFNFIRSDSKNVP